MYANSFNTLATHQQQQKIIYTQSVVFIILMSDDINYMNEICTLIDILILGIFLGELSSENFASINNIASSRPL